MPQEVDVFEAVWELLDYLEMRWQDEAAHEDWADYEGTVKKEVEKAGAEFVSLSGGFTLLFNLNGGKYEIKLDGEKWCLNRKA